ncbi:SH3 domain-containing protein [Candidatus Saccharibacteria bacterium]|nr:SH3 domain-containing protein [Candidatus Saccharibacteria bacterium]
MPEISSTTGSPIAKAETSPWWVKPNKLKVYKKASASSKIVAILKKDDKVIKYGSEGDWIRIRYKKGKFGYVKRSDLKYHCSIKGWKKHAEETLENLKTYATSLGWNIDYCSDVTIEDREFDGNHYKVVLFFLDISNDAKKLSIHQWSSPGDLQLYYDLYLGNNSAGGRLYTKEVRSVIEKYAI